MKLTKEMGVASLYLEIIHLLIVKLLIIKEFSPLMVKMFH
jgi:hypothetical protein